MANQQRVIRLVVSVVAAAVVIGFFAYYFPTHYGPTDTGLFAQAMYIGVAAMGLNLLTGYNGQVSLGHGAFFGIGAYTTALMMDHHYQWLGISFGHSSFIATLPVVAVVSFVIGALVGFPALRVKGLYLALVTLGLAVIFPDLASRFVKGHRRYKSWFAHGPRGRRARLVREALSEPGGPGPMGVHDGVRGCAARPRARVGVGS